MTSFFFHFHSGGGGSRRGGGPGFGGWLIESVAGGGRVGDVTVRRRRLVALLHQHLERFLLGVLRRLGLRHRQDGGATWTADLLPRDLVFHAHRAAAVARHPNGHGPLPRTRPRRPRRRAD
jgi:hypothetical protein